VTDVICLGRLLLTSQPVVTVSTYQHRAVLGKSARA
jgi:hypothetical protein